MSTQPNTDERSIDRRTFIKGVGASAAAGVGIGASNGPVQESEAVVPALAVGAGAMGIGAGGAGWLLRDAEILGSDDVPEGVTEEALIQEVYQVVRTRESNDRSTFVDNKNLIEGVEHTAYADAKIEAVEGLNDELSQDEIQDLAIEVVDDYETEIKTNLLSSWNEFVHELTNLWDATVDHPEVDEESVWDGPSDEYEYDWSRQDGDYNTFMMYFYHIQSEAETLEMPDGTEFELQRLDLEWDERGDTGGHPQDTQVLVDPTVERTDDYDSGADGPINHQIQFSGPDSDVYTVGDGEWNQVYSEIDEVFTDVRDGIIQWVDTVYSEVQSGEIDTSELLTPREQAEMMADGEQSQAVADLVALNVPVDPEREATIRLMESDTTLTGMLAPTSEPDGGIIAGGTYDPTAADWDLYFSYDTGIGSSEWSDFETTVSEGSFVLTADPWEEVLYRAETNAGTIEATSSDFSEETRDGSTVWVADVSDQVEETTEEWDDYESGVDGGTVTFGSLPEISATFTVETTDGDEVEIAEAEFVSSDGDYVAETDLGITEIESVRAHLDRATIESEAVSVYAEEDRGYETVQIKQQIEVVRIEDSDGEEVDEAEFASSEPQSDDNYISQDEWDELRKQNEELIEKYEESQDDGGGLLPGWGDGTDSDVAGLGAVVGGVAVVGGGVYVLKTIADIYLPG